MLTPVLGALADHWGLRTALTVLAVLPVVALLLSLRLRDPVSRPVVPEPATALRQP